VTTATDHSLNAHAQAGAMGDTTDPDPEVPQRARRPRRYSAKYKAQVLEEYEGLDKAGKGALLRREGRYTSLISEWRKQRDRGALQALANPAGRQPADPRDREVARLRRETQRLASELDTGPQADRGPGKALGAVGAARHRQRDRAPVGRDELIDQASPS
jgi:transposase